MRSVRLNVRGRPSAATVTAGRAYWRDDTSQVSVGTPSWWDPDEADAFVRRVLREVPGAVELRPGTGAT